MMNRFNFANCSGVVLDACKPHGVWFDADELRRIVRFIRAGGLDLARAKERQELALERRLHERGDQDQDLQSGRMSLVSPASIAAARSLLGLLFGGR